MRSRNRIVFGALIGSLCCTLLHCGSEELPQISGEHPKKADHAVDTKTTGEALGCGAIRPGESLTTGQALWSCGNTSYPDGSNAGNFFLIMQGDGNLVLYWDRVDYPFGPVSCPPHALWSSNTPGTNASIATMQGDGNFVLYNGAWQAFWATWTQGHPGAYFRLQDDGNLVVYSQNNVPLWWSGTSNTVYLYEHIVGQVCICCW